MIISQNGKPLGDGQQRRTNENEKDRHSLDFRAQAEGLGTDDLIRRLLKEIPEPEISKFVSVAAQRVPPPPPPGG